MYRVDVTFEPITPDGDILSEADWKITGQIVKQEIALGMDEQVQINGTAYPRLKPKTIKRKQKKGSPTPTKRLLDTGNMRNSPRVTAERNGVVIYFGPQREEIAPYHQLGTENIPAVDFFGISERCADRIIQFWTTAVDRWLSKTRSV